MNVLILGATGMIGSAMVNVLRRSENLHVLGTTRDRKKHHDISEKSLEWVYTSDLSNSDQMTRVFEVAQPDVVVNCAGLTKHLPGGNDPISALTMNALLPHRISKLCTISGARLIHISTDCVYSGSKGNYTEECQSDALDIYGKTKYLGEVQCKGVVTLRTSTIGHEIGTKFGLLEWFLGQNECFGYSKAIFSGLTTLEFAKIVRDMVIPNTSLEGLYHVGGEAIDKDTLLRLIAKIYKRRITVVTEENFMVNRSLNSNRFTEATGYLAPSWEELIEDMRKDFDIGEYKNV